MGWPEDTRQVNFHTYPPGARSGFIEFWKTINEILVTRGQAEMLYGEARRWFNDMSGWQR